ncbi:MULTISPECIES: hypothetical protein [unclassified Janthinobacterium]|uniref:hypothetical protein n=1 Tax=unclassified Janthinobacterium TaxID=2610881 RepID=UPI00034D6046|nr:MULTISPECIES: hypothetical protein [unclassified Janthinobacterium]MEC5162421.1 hypothetical protein [Janthinobacterium sp. CG_S6]
MKLSYPRTLAALTIVLSLSACGGKESFQVNGTLSGVSDNDLVLTNNGDTVAPKKDDTSFTFPKQIDYGTAYNITANQPAHMNCSVAGGSGSAGHFTSITATVVCTRQTRLLGGSVTGLKVGNTVKLANGKIETITVTGTAAASVAFQFAVVADGTPYSVVVVPPQPNAPNQTCSVANGAGVMGTAAVSNVLVTCI